jgi:hypothetical protein
MIIAARGLNNKTDASVTVKPVLMDILLKVTCSDSETTASSAKKATSI